MISQLKRAFQQPLPGVKAHFRMAHTSRFVPPVIPDNAKESAVLVLFYPWQSDWHLVLIQRTNDNPNDRHGGQISFPGGRQETMDENLQATALREAEEEIGITCGDIQIMGALTDLYIPVSNFKVQPYVGVVDYKPEFTPQLSEVANILSPSFNSLQNGNSLQYTDMRLNSHLTIKKVPYFAVDDHIVWGATAMIISEVLVMIENL